MIPDIPPYPIDFNQPSLQLYISDEKSMRFSYISNKPKQNLKIEYQFLDNKFILDNELKSIVDLLYKSENILTLEDNWDDLGSEKISTEAWISTVMFLTNYSKRFLKEYGYTIDLPKIYPSSNGSIDIAWEKETYGILINIDKSGNIGSFFADDKSEQMTQGVFNPKKFSINLLPKAISF